MADKPGPSAKAAPTDTVEQIYFHLIKGSQFRVVHADGAFGGWTPRGYLHFIFYNERQAIPQVTVRELISQEGNTATYGAERAAEGKEGFVRELEVDVMMDIRTVKEFSAWLNNKIGEWEAAMKQQEADDERG